MQRWVRLWDDMPIDPKFRVIARIAEANISEVIAIFTFLMLSANQNGVTQCNAETVTCALDLPEGVYERVLKAMQNRVIEGEILTGWRKRQPLREDNSKERVRLFRERKRMEETDKKQCNACVTQCNAPESESESESFKKNLMLAEGGSQKKGRVSREGVELPESWEPNHTHEVLCERLNLQLGWQAAKMRDWAQSKGIRRRNWDATFSQWLRTASERISR